MHATSSADFLRRVLLADAIGSAVSGVGLFMLAGYLGTALALPEDLLREAGIVLLPFAALVGFVASRADRARGLVWAVITMNVIWVVQSIALLLMPSIEPNAAGTALVIAQAVAVGILAELEYVGLRRTLVAS